MEKIFFYDDIVEINSTGIYCKNDRYESMILFENCSRCFAMENSLNHSRCVATRDILKGVFTFFTTPKTKILFKTKRRFLIKNFSYVNDFHILQNQIISFGFTTYDLT